MPTIIKLDAWTIWSSSLQCQSSRIGSKSGTATEKDWDKPSKWTSWGNLSPSKTLTALKLVRWNTTSSTSLATSGIARSTAEKLIRDYWFSCLHLFLWCRRRRNKTRRVTDNDTCCFILIYKIVYKSRTIDTNWYLYLNITHTRILFVWCWLIEVGLFQFSAKGSPYKKKGKTLTYAR